jgi:hypothetical protein
MPRLGKWLVALAAMGLIGAAASLLSGAIQIPIVAVPEPAEWMRLPCGLVFAAFMAWRKTSSTSE